MSIILLDTSSLFIGNSNNNSKRNSPLRARTYHAVCFVLLQIFSFFVFFYIIDFLLFDIHHLYIPISAIITYLGHFYTYNFNSRLPFQWKPIMCLSTSIELTMTTVPISVEAKCSFVNNMRWNVISRARILMTCHLYFLVK